jgi:hypothetical protein
MMQIGDFTTFIVAGISKTEHKARNQHILDQVSKVKASLRTQNSRIGKVMIETFKDQQDLSVFLPLVLDRAFKGEL